MFVNGFGIEKDLVVNSRNIWGILEKCRGLFNIKFICWRLVNE